MRTTLPLLALLVACGPSTVDIGDTSNDTDATDTGDTGDTLQCAPLTTSVCGNPASVVQGRVRIGSSFAGPTTGTLFIALAHQAYSGEIGGGYHAHTTIPNADLSAGAVEFSLDMCSTAAMWSEDNCDYGLVVILDQNGNQDFSNIAPDVGEPATRVADLTVSCNDDQGPCLDIVLDCVDGASCVEFSSPPTCSCDAETCGSDVSICG